MCYQFLKGVRDMEVLSVQGLCKRYPRFCLDHVSFSLEQGKIMGFIGRNGAGKTTTLKALLNLVHPDAGDIRFFGLPWAGHEKEIKPRIGFVSGGVDYYSKKKLKVITDVTRTAYLSLTVPGNAVNLLMFPTYTCISLSTVSSSRMTSPS